MFKRIGQIVLLIFVCLLLADLQFSFISSLPGVFNQINLGLIFLIFILFFFGIKTAVIFIFIFGFLIDSLSFQFFGFYFISLAGAALASYLILKNWLTNKSLYSFWALFLIATISYNLLASIMVFMASNFQGVPGFFSLVFWRNVFYQSAWNLLAGALFFNFLASLAKKFKPSFLEKNEGL